MKKFTYVRKNVQTGIEEKVDCFRLTRIEFLEDLNKYNKLGANSDPAWQYWEA